MHVSYLETQRASLIVKDWKAMKIAILGHGVVGRGVDEIIASRVPSIEVKRILELPDRLSDPRMVSDFDLIVSDPQIEAVVECMGGIEPAHSYIAAALKAGKSVVTSNKAVVAAHLEEFASLANESGAALLIEASVGGGIPWIASIEKVRRIDEVLSFSGILNGTTNYILDTMAREGATFEHALAQAQSLGYAERDPSDDIHGIDVRNKTIITASVAFGCMCKRDIPVTGISNYTKADAELFAASGRVVKLLARGVRAGNRYAVAVEPVAVLSTSLEANVPMNFNLATLEGTTVGELKFYGQGAGSLPTGNAMVQDLIDLAAGRHPSYDLTGSLVYDPSLLIADYVLRSSARPEGSVAYGEGSWLIRSVTAEHARRVLDNACAHDEQSLLVRLA